MQPQINPICGIVSVQKILFIILLLGSAISGHGQTVIPGGEVSGTWTAAGSPYLVNGAIMIAHDSTLVIEPSVSIVFQGNYKLLVLGRLIAIGTPEDSISITAADTTNGWLGIRFENTNPLNDTSRIAYCKIQYGKAMAVSPNDCGGAFYFEEYSKAIISNSLISNCAADDDGGAIYCINSSPRILNNAIENNSSNSGGGAIYCNNSSPLIVENTISSNTANDGAIACRYGSNPVIMNNVISNNTAVNCCGGIWCQNSDSYISGNIISYNSANMSVCVVSAGGIICDNGNHIITGNTITHNTAEGNGSGGIFCLNCTVEISNNLLSYNTALNSNSGGGLKSAYCNAIVMNNVISNNTSSYDGGGIYCAGDNTMISYNFIANNTAAMFGGGVYCKNEVQYLTDNVIANNSAEDGGGGVCFCNSMAGIFNNTISNNAALNGGALYFKASSAPIVQNTILWGNTASTGEQVYIEDDGSDPDFYYCDVQGGKGAFGLNANVFYMGAYENNIDSIPFFMTPSGGSGTGFNGIMADWSLQDTSPCIDAGDPAGTYPELDMAGNPRVIGNAIDIGAYEYQGNIGLPHHDMHDQVSVFPNPFNNFTTIHIKNVSGRLQLGIYDMGGKRMRLVRNISCDNIRIEREHLDPGIYIFELIDEMGDAWTGRLVVVD